MESVAILGFGVAARAAYRYLSARMNGGIRIYLLPEEYARVRETSPDLPLVCGMEHIREEVIVRSPGIRPDIPSILSALAGGARMTSEIALFMDACRAPVYAVTGSDGKTTTATLAAEMFRRAGYTVHLGGNIGVSLLDRLEKMTPQDRVVLELSSFQLMDMIPETAGAVITNLTENHLNWHTDMQEYKAAKSNLLIRARRRVENARMMMAPHLPSLTFSAYVAGANYHLADGCLMHGDEELIPVSQVKLRGTHNLENMLAAAALTDVRRDAVYETATTFSGVAHRMEYCGIYRGVACYNSSIDTTPARTAVTLASLGDRCTVICGGEGKNLSYLPLADALIAHAERVVFTGSVGEEMEAVLTARGGSDRCPTHTYVRDFDCAVDTALALTPQGGTLVLSPAATSFDAFSSYTARGERFRSRLLRHLA